MHEKLSKTRCVPDVISQVRDFLPEAWRASFLAVDPATTEEVPAQLQRIPPDASYLVLSAGGNDALMKLEIFDMPADSTSHARTALADVSQDLRRGIAGRSGLPEPAFAIDCVHDLQRLLSPPQLSSSSPPLLGWSSTMLS